MEKDTKKGAFLNCVAPRQRCSVSSSNSMLMARFTTGKGLVVLRRLRPVGQIVMHSPWISCKTLCAILRLNGTSITYSNVSRRLSKEFGLKSHKLARKPHLTPVMKKKEDETSTEPNGLGCHVVSWHCWSVFHHYEWTKVREIAQREAKTARERPRLHDLYARWRSLSPIKGSNSVPEEKQDICTGMPRDHPRSQSNREPVDYIMKDNDTSNRQTLRT